MGNDSCRLIALNMVSAVDNPFTPEAEFNYDRWYDTTYKAQFLMDDLVDLELELVQNIIDKVKSDPEPDHVKATEIAVWEGLYESGRKYRRTGLGFTGLGDTLASLGIKYDNSLKIIEKIAKTKFKAEWQASIDLSKQRGTFNGFDPAKETSDFIEMVKAEAPEIYTQLLKYGRRNISISTLAPTGSLSMLAKIGNGFGVSGGVEPVFALSYTRRKKIQNPDLEADFVDALGDRWQEFQIYHTGHSQWAETNDKALDDPDTPYMGATAPEIDWAMRVKIQGVLQKYTTHSISSTINLPKTTTLDTVSNIYLESWKHGLKGVTIYRDGSRSGIMITEPETERDAPKRPKKLPCVITNTKRLGSNWVVLIGYLNGNPYEVFAFENGTIKSENGFLVKQGRGIYDLTVEGETIIKNITETHMFDESEALTRLISLSLRHGIDLKYIYEQLDKSKGAVVNFSKVVNRTLKKFVKTFAETKMTCPECGETLMLTEGCKSCTCGYTAC